MGSVKEFRDAIEKIGTFVKSWAEARIQDKEGSKYVRDMNNWLCVHATRYMPLKAKDGGVYIPTTAMATGFAGHPRSTVHFTLNHVVRSHAFGNWDATPFIILAPYKSVVELNQNPAELSPADTYWSVDPDVGLRLPENTYIIKPSNDVLFNIGEHGATYKTDNFTDEEIEQIESMLLSQDRKTYDKYKNASFPEWEVRQIIEILPESLQKAYALSRDKKAFLRGMFEESKYEILTMFLRNAVVKLAMDKIGYKYIYEHGDTSRALVETARATGLNVTCGDKGHSGSVYNKMEDVYEDWMDVFEGDLFNTNKGVYNQRNVDGLYDDLVKVKNSLYSQAVMNSIINNKPIDFYREYQYMAANHANVKSIAEFDKNLDKTLRKNADMLAQKYMQWLAQVKQWSGYDDLVVKLKALLAQVRFADKGRDF